jgi:hypothetical protein
MAVAPTAMLGGRRQSAHTAYASHIEGFKSARTNARRGWEEMGFMIDPACEHIYFAGRKGWIGFIARKEASPAFEHRARVMARRKVAA